MLTIMGIYVLVIMPVFQLIESYKFYTNFTYLSEPNKYLVERTLLVLLVLISTIVFPSVSVVLSISGCITGTLLSIIFPVFYFNKAFKDSENKSYLRKINYFVLVIGSAFGTIGLIETIRDLLWKFNKYLISYLSLKNYINKFNINVNRHSNDDELLLH